MSYMNIKVLLLGSSLGFPPPLKLINYILVLPFHGSFSLYFIFLCGYVRVFTIVSMMSIFMQ